MSDDNLPPLPETDVSWVDGRDQWGYDTYESAYSAEALQAYARAALAAQPPQPGVMFDIAAKLAESHKHRADDCGRLARAMLAATAQPPAQPVEPQNGDSPLSDFQEGQWWVKELDDALQNGTAEQRRAVAVVHHLLRVIAAQPAHPLADPVRAAIDAVHARTVERAQRLGLDDESQPPAHPAFDEAACRKQCGICPGAHDNDHWPCAKAAAYRKHVQATPQPVAREIKEGGHQ